MGKIVVYNVPAYGHINPSLPVVKELVDRGEDVVYFNHEDFRKPIEATGAAFRPIENLIGHDFTRRNKTFVHLVEALLKQSRAYLPIGLKEFQSLGDVDLVIHDVICPWGRFIAELNGTPRVCFSSTLAMHPTMLRKSASPANIPFLVTRGFAAFFRYRKIARELQRQYGLSNLGPFSLVTNHGDCNVVFTSREFQPYLELLDNRYHFVGPSVLVDQNADANAAAYLEQGLPDERLVFISLGTVFTDLMPFYHACMRNFADIGCPVVMVVGKNTNMDELGTPPENFFVRQFVPQLEVLKRSKLFITHGGTNSVSEGLYFGVPLMILPPTSEHAFVGASAASKGTAKVMSMKDLQGDRLKQIAQSILSQESYYEAARRIGDSFRAAGGYRQAADIVQAHRSVAARDTSLKAATT